VRVRTGHRARLALLYVAGVAALVVPLVVASSPGSPGVDRNLAMAPADGTAGTSPLQSVGSLLPSTVGSGPSGLSRLASGRGADGSASATSALHATTTGARGSRPGPFTSGNLLTGRAATFDGTTGNWIPHDATLTWVAAPASTKSGALSFGSLVGSPSPTSVFSGPVAAAPGLLYTGAATIRSDGTAEVVQASVQFYDAAGNLITQVGGQGSQTSPGSWIPLQGAIGIAPPGTATAALGVVAWSSSLLGQQTLVESPSIVASSDPGAPPVVGPLHTAGNQIVQANGAPVTLRGMQLFGLQSDPSPAWITPDMVAQAKEWGANMMRVSLSEPFWSSSSCSYVPTYPAEVDQVVNWITSLGMVALLDLHFNTILPCTTGASQMMADAPGSISFWNSVAGRYAANPLVAFDLYNEPHDISDQVWLNGGTAWSGLVPFQAAGMQQLYDAVRGTGAQNLVVVSGNVWGNELPATLVNGTNIVYGVHDYSCPGSPPPDCSTPDPGDPTPILGSWVARSASVPVMVTEFGWPSQFDGTFVRNVIAFAQAHGWGWNAFVFDDSGPWGLLSTRPVTGPYEPAASGMPVLAALANAP